MIYVAGFFVDFDDFSNICPVNCDLYPFENGISFFVIFTIYPTLNFSLVFFMDDFFIQNRL